MIKTINNFSQVESLIPNSFEKYKQEFYFCPNSCFATYFVSNISWKYNINYRSMWNLNGSSLPKKGTTKQTMFISSIEFIMRLIFQTHVKINMISKDPKSCQQTIAIINTSFLYSIAGSLTPNILPVKKKKKLTSIKSMFSCDNYVNETTKSTNNRKFT